MKTTLAFALVFVLVGSTCLGQASSEPTSIVPLPKIRIDDAEVHVHSQGLFVTDEHYFVTGRLETKPKRALLFRFSRKDPNKYEFVDLTPPSKGKAVLDHPGGFDRDAKGVYWIPISTSNRKGPTTVRGLTIDPKKPLGDALSIQHSIELDDHVGAVCCVENDLLAASWDTKTIYRLSTSKDAKDADKGKIVREALDRSKFIAGDPKWFLAVQDWKYDAQSKFVVAGGIDKSPARPREESNSVLGLIDLRSKTASTLRFDAIEGVARPLTNEGMALYQGELFLLPEDLGRGAKILRFKIPEMMSKTLGRRE